MVRMPEAMRRRLAKSAEENGRSLNGEVVWRLKQSLAVPEAEMTPEEKWEHAKELMKLAMDRLDGLVEEGYRLEHKR
jgi:hypothetical protein